MVSLVGNILKTITIYLGNFLIILRSPGKETEWNCKLEVTYYHPLSLLLAIITNQPYNLFCRNKKNDSHGFQDLSS
jgi:hypothetical protein